jgi:hypothetical protein
MLNPKAHLNESVGSLRVLPYLRNGQLSLCELGIPPRHTLSESFSCVENVYFSCTGALAPSVPAVPFRMAI